ncbi:hypothetical protein AWN76_007430 [Rhodothermaceae bacterium RA]|nr:hypothetical protein AWN76_007430 [Rhodothermaceae bacterium RA]
MKPHSIVGTAGSQGIGLGLRSGTTGMVVLGLMSLYLLLVPVVNVVPGVEVYDGRRLAQLAVLGILAVTLALRRSARDVWFDVFSTLPAAARWGAGLVLALGLASAAQAALPRYALLEVGHLVLLAVLSMAVAGGVRELGERADKLLVGFLCLSVGLYLIRFLVGYAAGVMGLMPLWPEGTLGFSHVRFFNQIQTWTLPLLALPVFLLSTERRGLRVISAGMLWMWWMLLFASGGRGTLLATVSAMFFVALVYGRRARYWLRVQGVAALAGLALYALLFKGIGHAGQSIMDRTLTSDSGRLELWAHAWAAVVEAPLLGIGPMHLAYYPDRVENAHPHNVLLQWMAEWGSVATVLLVVLVFWGLWAWVRQGRRQVYSHRDLHRWPVRIAITGSLVAASIHALLSGIVVMPVSQMLMVVVVGWALGCYQPSHRSHRAAAWKHHLLAGTVWLALLAVGLGVAPDLPGLPHRKEIYTDWTGSYDLRPRYWQQGFIGYENDRYPTEPVHPK